MILPTDEQVKALFTILRKDADASGFGSMVPDEKLQTTAREGAVAVVNAKGQTK
jgi:hypothetical protein